MTQKFESGQECDDKTKPEDWDPNMFFYTFKFQLFWPFRSYGVFTRLVVTNTFVGSLGGGYSTGTQYFIRKISNMIEHDDVGTYVNGKHIPRWSVEVEPKREWRRNDSEWKM